MSSPTVSAITPLDDAGLTDKEIKLLASAWLASTTTDLDIDKFAAIAGYPSPSNARKRFGEAKSRARAKIFGSAAASASPDGVGAPPTPKTPKAPKKASPKTPKANPKRKSPASGSDSAGSGGSSPKRGRTLTRDGEESATSAGEAIPSVEAATE